MKNLKSKLLLISVIVGIILILTKINFNYLRELGPIYLRVSLTGFPDKFKDQKLPPLPNYFSNNETLMGLDMDKNGIRDDLDYWIAFNARDYNERLSLVEVFKSNQKILYYAGLNNFSEFQKSMQFRWLNDKCLAYVSDSLGRRERLFKDIHNLVYNTKLRVDTLHFLSRHGYTYDAPPGYDAISMNHQYKACQFKLKI